jgi:hypothetical protein
MQYLMIAHIQTVRVLLLPFSTHIGYNLDCPRLISVGR